MRVWISVDMEGISGLVRWADVVASGMDFRRIASLSFGHATKSARV